MSALLTALIRPEGVILSVLMLASIVYINGIRKSSYTVLYYLGIFFCCGGAYFLWRWHYFGFPLPNPFYKKGDGNLYLDSLKISLRSTIKLCLPFLPAFIVGLYSAKTLRLTIGFLLLLVGFASVFVLISNDMNFGARFQYVLLPLTLMSWWPLTGAIKDDLQYPKWNLLNFQKRTTLVLLIIALSILE
jgi:hypothetical protein